MRVLIIDDHQLIRAAVRELLSAHFPAVECVEVSNGQAALARALVDDFDLAVIDLFLPDEAPFVLIRKLREQVPGLPLIVLSAADSQAHSKTAIELGAAAFISKGEAMDRIADAVQAILAGEVYKPPKPPLNNSYPCPESNSDELPNLALGDVLSVLTDRQIDILCLVAQGKSNKEIARERDLSDNTIKVHVSAVLRALNLNNRTQLGLLAQKIGILHGVQ